MQHYKGQFNEAVVFTDTIEHSAVAQVHRFIDHPAFAGGRIRVMPDVHYGEGAVIGFTMQLTDKVVPNVVGVDIGCGVAAWRLPERARVDFDRFEKYLQSHVPTGYSVREEKSTDLGWLYSPESSQLFGFFEEQVNEIIGKVFEEKSTIKDRDAVHTRVWHALGSMGGGNHFIELDRAADNSVWLVIHSGSRKLGMEIAKFHQRVAVERVGKMGGLEYLEGDDRERYIRDMKIAQQYARLNRRVMALELMKFFSSDDIDTLGHVESVHNYIDFGAGIIRKGAISAQDGEQVIIPLHLAAGCIIGTGKGLEDWNFSAPHGAGRVMARGEAKRTLDVDHYRDVVRKSGVWTTCVNKGTLDESPMVYRKPKQILADLEGIIDVKEVMRPIYVYKDGSQE